MPVAHPCPCCGAQLGGLAAGPDPIYGLPIVVCPGCDAAWVRRRHPIVARWRQARHAMAACGVIAGHLLLIGVMSALLCGVTLETERSLADRGVGLLDLASPRASRAAHAPTAASWLMVEGRAYVIGGLAVAAAAGVWLRATLGHLRLAARMLPWFGVLVILLSLDTLREAWSIAAQRLGDSPPHFRGPTSREWAGRMLAAATLVLVGTAASPLGGLLGRVGPAVRTSLLARRRAGARKRRQSQ